MNIPVITIEGNIGAWKTTLLQYLEQSLSMVGKIKIKLDHEPVGAFQTFFGNDMINPLQNFYQNPKENAFIFQSYGLHISQQGMEVFSAVEPMFMVIVMDIDLDSHQLFTTLNKHHLTDLGLLYLTDNYLDIKTRFFPGKLFATDGVFYLVTEPAEALERVSCRSHSGEVQITFNSMNDLDTGYNGYMDSMLSEINYCTITSEEDSPEEHLMDYIRTVVKDYDSEQLYVNKK